jgi:hypothetical protein
MTTKGLQSAGLGGKSRVDQLEASNEPPPCIIDLLIPRDEYMVDTEIEEDEPEEHIDETLSQTDEEQHVPFRTLSSLNMRSSTPEFRSTLPPTARAVGNSPLGTLAPTPGPVPSSSTPITVPVINLSDASSSGSRRRLGNTCQKHKSSALQSSMANVAKKVGESMGAAT